MTDNATSQQIETLANHDEKNRDISIQNTNNNPKKPPKLDPKIAMEIEEIIEEAIIARRDFIKNECIKCKKKLDLSSSRIDDLDALTIASYLNERKYNIELLHLGSNLIRDQGIIYILTGLQWHTALKELYLGNNYFTDLGISAVIDSISLFNDLEILSFSNSGMTDDNAVALSFSLSQLSNLKSLYLNSNRISNDGFISLSLLIASNQLKCSTLHVGDNPVSSNGLIPFLKSFEKNKRIKHLYINDIVLQNDSVKALAKSFIKNTYLEELNIGNCGIDDESLNLMKHFLMYNTGIKTIHIWSNRISNQGAELILSVLESYNHNLTIITLGDNPINDDDILNDIKTYLKQNETFESTNKTSSKPINILPESKNEQSLSKDNTSNIPEPEKSTITGESEEEETVDDINETNQRKVDLAKSNQNPNVENNKEEKNGAAIAYNDDGDDEEADEKEIELLEDEISKSEEQFYRELDLINKDKKKIEINKDNDKTKVWKGFEKAKGTDLLRSKF